MDELSSAVGGVTAAVVVLLREDTPANGAKKSRLNAARLRFGLNKNTPPPFTLQCEHSSRVKLPLLSASVLCSTSIRKTSGGEEKFFPSNRIALPKTRGASK